MTVDDFDARMDFIRERREEMCLDDRLDEDERDTIELENFEEDDDDES